MTHISKDLWVLTNDVYNTPKTSLLVFRFEPSSCEEATSRLQTSSIKHAPIDGKDLYLIDGFFSAEEGELVRQFSKTTTFSRHSYGSSEAAARGEKPALSMNNKERWSFFSNPPPAIKTLYALLGDFAHRMGADITTLPWELCDATTGSPAVIANFLEEASSASMDFGKHQDCHPEKGLAFGIPKLYAPKKELHPSSFVNGEATKPWMVSIMLYAAAESFLPTYCMGTVFYNKDEEIAVRANCRHMRLVIFEGDILHTIEESCIPPDMKSWRVSYVFKLIFNPKKPDQCMKSLFSDLLHPYIEKVATGNVRL